MILDGQGRPLEATETRYAADRYAIDVVIWDRTAALAQRLLADPDWRLLYTDPGWSVLCRRGADLSGGGSC